MQYSQAKSLTCEQRKQIAFQVISSNSTVTQIAGQYQTSRKFIKQQKNKAIAAINLKFKAKTRTIIILFTSN